MSKKGGSSGANSEAAMARADEAARQKKIRQGTGEIDRIFGESFNDDFFKGRETAFTDYATPQLQDQFADARKELTFALARNGTLDSSIRAGKEGELQQEFDKNDRAVKDQALAYGNEARTNVEGARSDLINTLNATGDAQGAANSALARASTLSAPAAFSPLAPLFANFTAGLSQQAQLERASALSGGAVGPRFNTGIFANPSAVRVS
jgi:hypothetical protein